MPFVPFRLNHFNFLELHVSFHPCFSPIKAHWSFICLLCYSFSIKSLPKSRALPEND